MHCDRLFVCLLLVLLIAIASPAVAEVDVSPMRSLPVLDNGRVKPLDSLARETVQFVTGQQSWKVTINGQTRKLDPLELLFAWQADSATWADVALLYVPNLELREKLGMDRDQKWISANGIGKSSVQFESWIGELSARHAAAERTREQTSFSRLEEAAMELARRLAIYRAAADTRLVAVLPVGHAEGQWATVHDILHAEGPELQQIAPLKDSLTQLLAAYRADNSAAFATRTSDFRQQLRSIGRDYPDQRIIDREVTYGRLHPFRLVWIAYLVVVALFVASLLIRSKWVYAVAVTTFVLTLVGHSAAFVMRCTITGWAPVTNMYETVVWVALVAAVIAMLLEAFSRRRTIAIAGASTAVIACVVADVMPPQYGHEIRNLTPVLRSNYWLIIHVLTIVSSYAAFALACVLGNIILVQFMMRGNPSERVKQNLQFVYRSVQIGVLLIAAGTILGGLWADVSWGRFWGWDPKEVWALIVLLTYLALLHGRFAGWIGQFGLAAGSIVAFSTVLMSWYGVNFVLGVGLHAYGFGSGGQSYVVSYVLAQTLFVLIAWRVHRHRHPKSAIDASSTEASSNAVGTAQEGQLA